MSASAALAEKQPEREGYYSPDGEGGWRVNGHLYTPEESAIWCRDEQLRCAANPIYFATHYCYTINEHLDDPYGAPPEVSLVPIGIHEPTGKPWLHPRAVLTAFWPVRDVLIEKSRDMMVSWMAMVAVTHDLLFRRNWKVMTLSRVEDLVDDGGENGTVDSLHGKVLFIWQHLPRFLQETAPLIFRQLRILNPLSDVHVSGFSATPSAGRGPKWQRSIIDEFAWVPHSEQVMASVTRACPRGKVLISTPWGKANAFYRIRTLGKQVFPQPPPAKREREKRRHWGVYTIHWSIHPEHDKAWFKRQVDSGSMTEESVAQELNISYTRSLGRRVYPSFNVEEHVAGQPLAKLRTVGYDPQRPLYLCCDFNPDPLIWVLVQPYPWTPRFRVIGEICRRNATIDDALWEFVIRFGREEIVRRVLDENPEWEDAYGQNGKLEAGAEGHRQPVVIFGDATEEKSTVYSRVKAYGSIKAFLRERGFEVVMKVPPKNPPRHQRFQVVNHAVRANEVILSWQAEQLRLDFETGVYNSAGSDMAQADDGDGSGLTRSHASSALGYMLDRQWKLVTTTESRPQVRRQPIGSFMPSFIKGW